jgi:hypothetical protein
MKKYFLSIIILLPLFTCAQSPGYSNQEFFIVANLIVLAIVAAFVIKIVKLIFETRLKNKIIDKGVSESIAASVLKSGYKEESNSNIKWFCLLASVAAGLTAVHYTMPLGIHSLAIMSFSISVGFLLNYLLGKYSSINK